MGEMGTKAMGAKSAHDLNVMFFDQNDKTGKRLARLRKNTFPDLLTPSAPSKTPTRTQSLRFAANELTRQVDWNASDPSRGNRRMLLKWLSWVEMDDGMAPPNRRTQAQLMVSALDYFVRAAASVLNGDAGAKIPTIFFDWNDDYTVVAKTNGTFAVTLTTSNGKPIPDAALDPTLAAITISVTSTDVYRTGALVSTPEDD